MHVMKLPDEFDTSSTNKKNQKVGLACPYCGNTKDNDCDIEYELRHSNKRPLFYKHKCKFRERLHEVGLYGMMFRRYHIMYKTAICSKCGAKWRSDMYDDDKPWGKYKDKGKADDHASELLLFWLCSLCILGMVYIFIGILTHTL